MTSEADSVLHSAVSGNGRVVLISGGNRGIGAACARAFINAGYRVAIICRTCEQGPEGTLTVRGDVTSMESIEAAVAEVEEKLGHVEVLVANAGITKDMLLVRMKEEDFSSVIDTNLSGAWRLIKRCSRCMLRARFGRIILVSSVSGYMGVPGQTNYSASKSGLVGLARSLTRELGGRGITANVIAPGVVETDMTSALTPEQIQNYKDLIPVGRVGEPEDVAWTALWLASDKASFVSGAVIPVDGGMAMGI